MDIKRLDDFEVILAPTADLAEKTSPYDASVEAEYGAVCVEGTQVTLAHHGPRSGNPAPCNAQVEPLEKGRILMSHIDLDALGGVMAVAGIKPEDPSFWQAAEYIDVNGPHHMHDLPQKEQDKLNAYYAFEEKAGRPRYPRDAVSDVKEAVKEKAKAIDVILDERAPGHDQMIQDGIKWERDVTAAVEACLVEESDKVRTFSTPRVFCSANYYSPNKEQIIPATVSYNQQFQAITLAFADGGKELSAEKIMQEIFGPEAGGRGGIAGTPRNVPFTEEEAKMVSRYVEASYREREAIGKNGMVKDIDKKMSAMAEKSRAKSSVRNNPYFKDEKTVEGKDKKDEDFVNNPRLKTRVCEGTYAHETTQDMRY